MNKGDQLIDRGADRLEELSRKAAAKGGFAAKFADELAEDAEFLRKLKPSLIAARARGEPSSNERPASPTNEQPTAPTNEPAGAPADEPVNEPVATEAPPQAVGSTSRLEAAGGAPTNEPAPRPEAPPSPRFTAPRPQKPPKKKRRGGGPNPFVVLGVAVAAGILLAKVVDWRGHAHPRD